MSSACRRWQPAGPERLHEIKHDGFRLRLERDGDRVRLVTRSYDWTKRYPWIAECALKDRIKQFVIDGEAVVLDVDGDDLKRIRCFRPPNDTRRWSR